MNDKIELKPCPFCGGKAFWDSDFSGVYCHCGAEITFCESDKEAAEKWNIRPIEDELRKELRYYRNYSAALEKEVKTLRNALDQIRITLEAKKDGIVPTRFNLDSVDGYMMLSIVKKALKAK
jgi:Lar family restriction alleviation protein